MIQLQPPRSKDIEETESKPESSKAKKRTCILLRFWQAIFVLGVQVVGRTLQ